ncbi:MAG: aldehyde dehydrogenase family protein [Gemmatimonadales bacterium]|nr:MAG: aldehyde dehydrogenase family protein [Gemmatimonadales bacterium]
MTTIARIFETMEYGPAPESTERAEQWLKDHAGGFDHFIGGRWSPPSNEERFDSVNPANGRVLGSISHGSPEDVDRAVRAAEAAQEEWWAGGPHRRARVLYAIARSIQRHARLFAVLESMDNGKPIRESRDLDIPLVARHFYHHAGWAQLLEREFPGMRPHGVVGQVIPWNFPLLMLAWKVAPALAAGNTLVLKPAEYTSLTALLFAELCDEAGVPPGVVNVVTGDGRTGAALVAHPTVRKVAFTGSTEVGREIRRATAGQGKKLSLELGGKSPFIVYEDADLDSVVEGVVDAIWFNQGHVCCAGSRILVQEGVAELLEEKLRARMETLRMGNPLDKGVDMGAIVAPVQLDTIRELVERGRSEGAEIWHPSWAVPEEGLFYPPTLCTGVEPAGTLAQVEIFGPVVAMMTFRTHQESIALANNTRYGLAASIWTENLNLALEVAPAVKAGTVWINCTNLFDAASGFGGYRESGFGREGGREGMYEYLRLDPDPGEADPADRPAEHRPRSSVTDGMGGPTGDSENGPRSAGERRPIDRTPKLYIGGRQKRPDGGYTLSVLDPDGQRVGEVPRGNRKDVRDAVEAAVKAQPSWGASPAHLRAQILYYLAENLEARDEALVALLSDAAGLPAEAAALEVRLSVERLFEYAALADKYDGRVHATPFRNVTVAMVEPLGVLAVAAPEEAPLLGLISAIAPAIAMGNTVIALPSEHFPLVAQALYQLLDTSDVPAGVVNLLTGPRAELVQVLAAHDAVDGIWSFGSAEEASMVERESAGNLKRCWSPALGGEDWLDAPRGAGERFLREATQVKNIWIPYGA